MKPSRFGLWMFSGTSSEFLLVLAISAEEVRQAKVAQVSGVR
jgi:hypothetical protein